jgi:signal transduction protein with GAF and PtsI domain
MNTEILKVQILARGEVCHGVVGINRRHNARNHILVTERLSSVDYSAIRKCRAVICENGGITDHPSILCRIIGKPVVLIENATKLLREGEEVTVDAINGLIYKGRHNTPVAGPSQIRTRLNRSLINKGIKFQVSIVDESDITKINQIARRGLAIDQFFLREELVWMKENVDPFRYLRQNGVSKTSMFLKKRLLKCLTSLRPEQTLNYRSLDLRSDQRLIDRNSVTNKETNPELGLHGIRDLLQKPELFITELKAVDTLYRSGYDNLIFSIPFITEKKELQEVKRIMAENCTSKIKIGIFIETPAAVYELPSFLLEGVNIVYIGTKDLTQTILACDRSNEAVRHIYDSRKQPVQAAIKSIVKRCTCVGIPVVIFALYEDIQFYLRQFPKLQHLSVCCSDYKLLLAADSVQKSG